MVAELRRVRGRAYERLLMAKNEKQADRDRGAIGLLDYLIEGNFRSDLLEGLGEEEDEDG